MDNEVEYIDLVDGNNNVVGVTDVGSTYENRQYHRVMAVLLFDADNKMILQSGTKYNLLEPSFGGHVKREGSYEDAAYREMYEELAVITKLTYLSTFLPKNNKLGHFWGMCEGKLPENWVFKATEEVKNCKDEYK